MITDIEGLDLSDVLRCRNNHRRYQRLNMIHRRFSIDEFYLGDYRFNIDISFMFNKITKHISFSPILFVKGVPLYYGKNKSLDDISHATDSYIKNQLGRG